MLPSSGFLGPLPAPLGVGFPICDPVVDILVQGSQSVMTRVHRGHVIVVKWVVLYLRRRALVRESKYEAILFQVLHKSDQFV